MCDYCQANPSKPCVECGQKVCIEKRAMCIDCGGWICPDCMAQKHSNSCSSCWLLKGRLAHRRRHELEFEEANSQ